MRRSQPTRRMWKPRSNAIFRFFTDRFPSSSPIPRLSAFATMRPTFRSQAHASEIIEIYCDPGLMGFAAAFQRPERTWWHEWKPKADPHGNDEVMKDGREGRFQTVDLFALQLSDVISKLSNASDDDPTEITRYVLLEREKARLTVIDAKSRLYAVERRRLPASLKDVGDPVDPISNRPYMYRITSAKTYDLAAVGIPGIDKIDANTKVPPEKTR